MTDLARELDPEKFNKTLISPNTSYVVPQEKGLISTPGGLSTVILAAVTWLSVLVTLLLL